MLHTIFWVAVKELKKSYNPETIFFTIYPYYGSLNLVSQQQLRILALSARLMAAAWFRVEAPPKSQIHHIIVFTTQKPYHLLSLSLSLYVSPYYGNLT